MIEVTINCNDDSLRIKGKAFDKECKLRHPVQVANLLEELFELITDDHDPIGVTLTKIDEDRAFFIGEY